MRRTFFAQLVMALLVIAGMTHSAEPRHRVSGPMRSETADSTNLRMGQERFTHGLMTSLLSTSKWKEGNAVVSPSGVFETLLVLRRSASGKTREEFDRLLQLTSESTSSESLRDFHASGNPLVYQFPLEICDNDSYGVKVAEAPQPETPLATEVHKGDLIFSVNSKVVRSAKDFIEVCASAANGSIKVVGYDSTTGEVFRDKSLPLARVRQLSTTAEDRVLSSSTVLCLDHSVHPSQAVMDSLESNFDATVVNVDFRNRKLLERLVGEHLSKQTGARVAQFESSPTLPRDGTFLLVNAQALDATWTLRFPPAESGLFHAPTVDVDVPMMHKASVFRYAEFSNLQILELPFRNSSLSVWIVLPAPEEELGKTLLSVLGDGNMNKVRQALVSSNVDLRLPKFSVAGKEPLREVIMSMGISSAFQTDSDFSELVPENGLKLVDLRQQASFDLNEVGVKANAVTEAIGLPRSPAPPVKFFVDRPFCFFVVDSLGGIFFVGRVENPKTSAIRGESSGNPQ